MRSDLFVSNPLSDCHTTATYSASASSALHSDLNYYSSFNGVNYALNKKDDKSNYFWKTDNKNELIDITLRNGCTLPLLGLGTSHSGGYSHSAVVYALKQCKYRMLDTAKRYGCEQMLAEAIK
ncbi:putative oxidoreductase-like protein, partial [Leptotrombidium deliense]